MAITLSNGKEVNLYSARFLHIYLLWKNQSKELGGFQSVDSNNEMYISGLFNNI